MNIFQFMNESPVLTFLLAVIIGEIIIRVSIGILKCWNIHKHGYPPEHCDAIGNLNEDEE